VNRFKSIFLATLTLGAAVQVFAGDTLAEFKAYMNAMTPKVVKAFEKEDIGFFEKISTPDFKTKEGPTVMNKQQSMAQLKSMFGMASNIKAKFKMVSVKLVGKDGVVVTDGSYTMDMATPDGKTHKMAMQQRMTEKYRKTPKGWMIYMIENHPGGKMTMDGKPFDPSSLGGPPPPAAKPKSKIG
jgi:ketosteroid isomerase-like protein